MGISASDMIQPKRITERVTPTAKRTVEIGDIHCLLSRLKVRDLISNILQPIGVKVNYRVLSSLVGLTIGAGGGGVSKS
jgi:hypothetical protein